MVQETSPIILWHRRDLRLSDHPAMRAACDAGRPVIPVFILDDLAESLGAAPKWRLGLGLEHHAAALKAKGSRLILRRGPALKVLQSLIQETGAGAVFWSRLYDPDSVARDTDVKARLKQDGIQARSFGGHLLFEPWTVETQQGGFYKVFTPYWKAVAAREVEPPLAEPATIAPPEHWPDSDTLDSWTLDRAMHRGAQVVRPYVQLGEAAALDRLDEFADVAIAEYRKLRDFPAKTGATSNLSENLSLGEISPHRCWHLAVRARAQGAEGAQTFLKELVWREFAYHLMHHSPHILTRNWRDGWDRFPWKTDARAAEILAWKRARTGIPFVDAGLREMYVTGRMHNRTRMIVGSYLTKHLMTHWKVGQAWFEDCLIDWDPASNAMGWQWVSGSGPDSAPYFRVFNPVTQLDKFDPSGSYADRWIAEGRKAPSDTALSYFEAVPRSWNLSPDSAYPEPVTGLKEGRTAALEAYAGRDF